MKNKNFYSNIEKINNKSNLFFTAFFLSLLAKGYIS